MCNGRLGRIAALPAPSPATGCGAVLRVLREMGGWKAPVKTKVRKSVEYFGLSHVLCQQVSQNHRIVGVGRDLCGSSSPIPLPKQGHLQ